MTVTVLDKNTLVYRYGDTETTVQYPLPIKHAYTKSQADMVKAVTDLGWELDTTAVRVDSYNRFDTLTEERRVQAMEQHPFMFVREDADGGWWQLELDYVSRDYSYYSSRRSFNKALLGAKLRRFTPSADEVHFDNALSGYASWSKGKVVLQKQSTAGYASTNWVTAVAAQGGRDTLRAQVLALATDPGLVVWLAAESEWEADQAEAARRRARRAEEEARQAPLPAGWDELKVAAKAVAKADGLTDLKAVKAALEAALAAVEDEVVVR